MSFETIWPGLLVLAGILAGVAAKSLTAQGRKRMAFVLDLAEEIFTQVETDAPELGLAKYEKLAEYLRQLSAKMEEQFGSPLTPAEEAAATKFAAATASKLKV